MIIINQTQANANGVFHNFLYVYFNNQHLLYHQLLMPSLSPYTFIMKVIINRSATFYNKIWLPKFYRTIAVLYKFIILFLLSCFCFQHIVSKKNIKNSVKPIIFPNLHLKIYNLIYFPCLLFLSFFLFSYYLIKTCLFSILKEHFLTSYHFTTLLIHFNLKRETITILSNYQTCCIFTLQKAAKIGRQYWIRRLILDLIIITIQ